MPIILKMKGEYHGSHSMKHGLFCQRSRPALQNTMDCIAKHHILHCKTPHIAPQNATYCTAKRHGLHREKLRPAPTPLISVSLA